MITCAERISLPELPHARSVPSHGIYNTLHMSYSCFTPKGSPLTVPHVHLYRHSVHGRNHRLSTGVTPEIMPEPWGPQMKHPRRLAQKSCSARCPPDLLNPGSRQVCEAPSPTASPMPRRSGFVFCPLNNLAIPFMKIVAFLSMERHRFLKFCFAFLPLNIKIFSSSHKNTHG